MSVSNRTGLAILAAAIALGIAGDVLLRGASPGLNVPIFAVCVILAAALTAMLSGQRKPLALPLAFVALLFAAGFAWRDSTVLKTLDGVALFAISSLAAVQAAAGPGFERMAAAAMVTGGQLIGGVPQAAAQVQWSEIPRGAWTDKAAAVGRGLLIALPLLLVFGGLFIAADAVFANYASRPLTLDGQKIAGHTWAIVLCGWLAGGLVRGTIRNGMTVPTTPAARMRGSLGIAEVATALALLDLLFLAFVWVQVQYLFGGHHLVQVTPHLTYADYARRGFMELVAAAALVLPVLLHAHLLLASRSKWQWRVFAALAGALIVMVLVVLASAFHRMSLYQQAYGQTELRFYTTAFMAWLAVVFLAAIPTLLTGWRRLLAPAAGLAALVTIVTLHVANPDARIAAANFRRAAVVHRFDCEYAADLSADAVPVLARECWRLSAPQQAALAAAMLRTDGTLAASDWRSWSWSRRSARAAVAHNRARLTALAAQPEAARSQDAGAPPERKTL